MKFKASLATITISAALASACGGDDNANNNNNNNNNNNGTITKVPSNITCDDGQTPPLCRFPAGEITEDMTWAPDRQFLLEGNVFIGSDSVNATLTIHPGTIVFGGTGLTALIIKPGSKIMAQGTREKPILFTSAKEEGARGRGDWGGVIINGRAPVNCGGAGSQTCQGEGNSGAYGGDQANDNSGVLEYVRVEFAGARINDEDEYNGIAFQGVGSATKVDHVHLHMPSDDGIEFFGGTVNAKHILVTGAGDDSLDWTFGYSGMIQYVVVQQYPDEAGHGIEADNHENNNALTPRSSPVISHGTFIGALDAPESQTGWLFRRGTEVRVSNSIVTGFDVCLDVDSAETFNNASANPSRFTMSNNIFHCPSPAKVFAENDEKDAMMMTIMDAFDLSDYVMAMQTGNAEVDPAMPAADRATPNFVPSAGSAALSGGQSPADGFFTASAFRGGVDPAADWTKTWTAFPAN